MRKAHFHISDRDSKNDIVYLVDDSEFFTSAMTITNDAENVVDYCRELYGNRVRVVYKDTDQEWWEIVWSLEHPSRTVVSFKRWHGHMWDKLSRVEQ